MSGFMDAITKLAGTVGTALGGPLVPAVLEIGKDVIKLIDNAKTVVETDDVDKLQALRDDLEPKVMAHATATEKSLRGA